ncbi:hypothetical protein BS78_06G095800 [Paspalum vaginatum]|nr:hypothetical protein BS78_06G095800 [Paspalum vaginatum]
MPFQPPRTQAAVNNGGSIEEQTVVIGENPPIEIIPQSKRAAKAKGKATVKAHGTGKRVSQRGKSFSKEEDRVLCSAFLNVNKDPITGTNQSSGCYYQRMHEYFEENMDTPTSRSQVAISNRWLTIQRAMNKFCGFFSTVERIDASGKTENDRIDDAVKMFEDKEPWTFMHCWHILRYEPKWNDKMLEINSGGTSTRVNQRVSANTPGDQDVSEHADNDPLARSEGRDTAKKRRSRGAGDNSASSTAIEVLQNMNEWEEMQKRWELEKEKLMLTREKVQMRKEQTKVDMLNAEAHFMGQDLEKLAPHMREYYLSIQCEIMERHGIRSPPNNSS